MISFFHSLGQSIWGEFPAFVAFLILFGLLICATLVARRRQKQLLRLQRKYKELQSQLYQYSPQEESKRKLQLRECPDKTSQELDSH